MKDNFDSKTERYVQTERGLRIEGKEKIKTLEGDRYYTWLRYCSSTKTMDDLKRG